MIQAVLAHVRNINVGPAIVIEVRNGHAGTPTIVGDAGLGGDIGERAVVIVVKECRVRRSCLAAERIHC